jgi:hypothetical protein
MAPGRNVRNSTNRTLLTDGQMIRRETPPFQRRVLANSGRCRISALKTGAARGGEVVEGGLDVHGLPEDDYVDHEAEGAELVLLASLVVLATPA